MGKLTPYVIISTVVALILVGTLISIGLDPLVAFDGSYTYANGTTAGTNATVGTLVGTVIPIMGVISLVMGFLSFKSTSN